ncbi:MAG TPA: D-alanyl-D-alanine carboxypeptidase, partial [Clostridiales bacterium]|nr:D-alanyl-D-alanine carboxypeptidase [Clostridiales bacterium]
NNYIEKTIFLDDINNNDYKIPEINYASNLTLNALSASLVDASNGRVLYDKDGYKQMAMASTTKIMTCILALERCKLDEKVIISSYAASMPDVQLNAKKGDEFYLKDLLYSLMLESHNDIAVAIAEHIGGSAEGFAKLMNEKAKELGCENTNFVTANGLDSPEHYTTAVELAKITSYAIQSKDFLNIIKTPSWSFNEIKKGKSYLVSNKDKFLYLYDGAIGVKTGYTNNAGYCFVGAVNKNGKTFVSTVLGSGWPPNRNLKWKDSSILMDYGMENFNIKEIFNFGKTFEPIIVQKGQKKYMHLFHYDQITTLISDKEMVTIVYKLPSSLEAPIKANTLVGYADYYINDTLIKGTPILTVYDIEKVDFKFYFNDIIKIWTFNK